MLAIQHLPGKRLDALNGIPTLDIPVGFECLESDITQLFQLPDKAATDESHLALTIVHEIDYLLTWNRTHLANAIRQRELIDYYTISFTFRRVQI